MQVRIFRIVAVLLLAACSCFAQVRGFAWGDSETEIVLGEGKYWRRTVQEGGFVLLDYLDRKHAGVSVFAIYYFFDNGLVGCSIYANGNVVPRFVLDVGAEYGRMQPEAGQDESWYYEDETTCIEVSYREGQTVARFSSVAFRNRGPFSRSSP